jgi:hypothetical protein
MHKKYESKTNFIKKKKKKSNQEFGITFDPRYLPRVYVWCVYYYDMKYFLKIFYV